MSSKKPIAIAAVLSLILLGGFAGLGYLLFLDDGSTPANPGGPEDPIAGTSGEPANSGEGIDSGAADPTPPPPPRVDRERLVVRVVEENTGSLIRGAHLVINRAEAQERAGEQVFPPPGSRSSTRRSNGTFTVDLLPGTYRVLAQAPGFQSRIETIQMAQGKDRQIEIALGGGLSISGIVFSAADRQPIGGAIVRAYKKIGKPDDDPINRLIGLIDIKERSQEIPAETTSNSDGTYQLDGLEEVHYDVVALAADHSPLTRTWVRPSKTGVDFPLPEGSVLTGVVMDLGGAPVEAASVSIFPEIDTQDIVKVVEHKARPPLVKEITGTDGRYEIRSVGQGIYNLLIQAEGYQPLPSAKLRIGPGENPPRNFTLKPGLVIAGEVVDEQGQPIVGARVRPMKLNDPQDRSAPINISFEDGSQETDENGAFSFNSLVSGGYNLLVWHDDFASQQVKRVSVGTTTLRVTLQRGSAMSGQVVMAGTGQPLEGARVLVNDLMDVKKEGISDENGNFLVSGLSGKRGNTFVTVHAEGYARLSNQTVVIPRDSELKNQVFELQPIAVVVGTVVDGGGNPVVSARVTARRPNPKTGYPVPAGSAVSNEDGRFAIELEAGPNTTLTAVSSQYLEVESDPFTIQPGEKLEVAPLTLSLGGTLQGKVVNEQGEPVQGVMVSVRTESETEFSYGKAATTDRKGEFSLHGLQAGKIDVQAKHGQYLEAIQPDIVIREGLINGGVQIVLEQGNRLAGTVVDGDGKAVQGATIVLREIFEGIKEHRQQSDSQGEFRFAGLYAANPVEIEVTHANHRAYRAEQVAVNRDDLEIRLERLGAIRGRVLGGGGAPLTNFSVKPSYLGEAELAAPSLSRQVSRSFSDPSGTFTYEGLPAGEYEVAVSAPGYAALVLPGIQVRTGETIDLGELDLPEGGMVDGRVIDGATGQPLAGVSLRLGGLNRSSVSGASRGAAVTEMRTGPDGTFLFRGLPDASTISMRVELDGYINQTITKINTLDASTCRNLQIEMEIGGEIVGTVIAADGNPGKGLSVYLAGIGGLRGQSGVNQTTRSDASGQFRFDGLRPGSYRVSARPRNARSATSANSSVEVQVLSGNIVELDLLVD